MSEERETRTREELFAALTVGAGLLVQGFVGLGGALHRLAQAFEDLAKVIENQILKDMEDEFVPMETESDDMEDPEDYNPLDEDDEPLGEPPVNP